MGPTWGPPGSCRPRMGPMLAPWTLLSGMSLSKTICVILSDCKNILYHFPFFIFVTVHNPMFYSWQLFDTKESYDDYTHTELAKYNIRPMFHITGTAGNWVRYIGLCVTVWYNLCGTYWLQNYLSHFPFFIFVTVHNPIFFLGMFDTMGPYDDDMDTKFAKYNIHPMFHITE